MSERRRTHARRIRVDESGVTVIEGMVAVLILVIGALGLLQVFDAGTRTTFRTEESQTVNNRLQAELEEIRQLAYAEIGLTQSPGTSGDSNNPLWRVQGGKYALGRDGTLLKDMVINGAATPGGGTVSGGLIDPAPIPFDVGDISGEIYRIVTWTTAPNCAGCGPASMKRVIVAATIDEAGVSSERAFQEIHTDIADPDAVPSDNPAPPEDDPGTATAQFWLTDTTCNNSQRQPITSDHPTHNTRGRCSDGAQTGSTRGAPDLMFIEAPALVEGQTPETQPLYDYATDVEPPAGAPPDTGLQAIKPTNLTENCLMNPVLSVLDLRRALEGILEPLGLGSVVNATDGLLDVVTSDTNKHLRTHTWLSPPISGTGGVLLGNGTLELFTKTVNGQTYRGEICATLFIRQQVTIPKCILVLLGVCVSLENVTIEADIPVVNVGVLTNQNGLECQQGLNLTYFRCSKDPWPTGWEKISIPMKFVGVNAAGAVIPLVLPPNSRIGLALMVNKNGTNGGGLEFMYDAVGFESRLELETNKILSF